MYYRGASAAIVVYDICSPQSFSKVKEWVNELKLNIQDEISMFTSIANNNNNNNNNNNHSILFI